jgi:hypothetical protein
VLVLALTACKTEPTNEPADDPAATPPRLIVLGDSLAEESMPYVHLLTSPEKTFEPHFFGGTAPCDWLDQGITPTADSIVVITFTGNSQTACMADGAGGFLAGSQMIAKYESDIGALVELARAGGARVLLVGQPIRRGDVGGNDDVDALNALYRRLAVEPFVSFVDAAAAVENPDGTYTQTLPCVAGEPECDPSGANVVRNDDGLHLCPGGPHVGACPTYASGAWRFALRIVDAVADPDSYEAP